MIDRYKLKELAQNNTPIYGVSRFSLSVEKLDPSDFADLVPCEYEDDYALYLTEEEAEWHARNDGEYVLRFEPPMKLEKDERYVFICGDGTIRKIEAIFDVFVVCNMSKKGWDCYEDKIFNNYISTVEYARELFCDTNFSVTRGVV